jgi:hypothetical protein
LDESRIDFAFVLTLYEDGPGLEPSLRVGVRNEDGALVWLTTARRKLSSRSAPTGNCDAVRGDVVFEVVPFQLWIARNNIGVIAHPEEIV